MRRLLLAAAFCLVLPAAALAQDANNPPPPAPGMPPGGWMPHGHMGGHGHHHMNRGEMLNKFYAANTTHDGHLTLAQAKTADLKPITDHFAQIDTDHHGYVTFYDIEAWHMDDIAKHLEMQANALRAKD